MKSKFTATFLLALVTALLTAQSGITAQVQARAEVALKAAIDKEIIEGDLKGAIEAYKKIAGGKDRALAAQALLRMAEVQRKLGDAEANKTYQKIVSDYSDQPAASTAKERIGVANGGATGAGVVNEVVWTLPDNASIGRVSPDGRYVAFTTRTDLMIREIVGKTERSIAHFSSGRPGPTLSWSHDGRRLAFEFTDGTVEIRTINMDGSSMRPVLSGIQGWARVLDFFPDGNRVLCSKNQNGDSLVFSLNTSDGSLKDLVLRPGGGGSGWPRLSPDGRYVALRNSPGLSLLATDGSGETILSRNGGDLNAAGWTSDSSRVLFIRQQGDRTDLWAAPVANGKPNGPASLVYRDFGSNNAIENQVTKDGSLHYVKSSVGSDEGEIYTASVDFASGKLLTEPLTEFSRGPGGVLWSPDGKYLAYSPLNSNPARLLVRTVETGQTREVLPKLRGMGISDWSPDGQKLAVTGQDLQGQTGLGIFQVDVQTGDAQLVAVQNGTVYDDARYSSDGRKLYYRRRARQTPTQVGMALIERDLATGQEHTVVDEAALNGKALSGIRPSPDGRYIAYSTVDLAGNRDVVIHIHPINDGQAQEIRFPASETSLCHAMDWKKDTSALIYHCDPPIGNNGGEGITWILPLADLKPIRLDLGFSEVSVSIHPDGRRIAFSAARSGPSELHVLANFLPTAK